MIVVTKKMHEAIKLARKQDNHINKHQLHHKTLQALLDQGILEPTQGYGWKYGAIFELTKKANEGRLDDV